MDSLFKVFIKYGWSDIHYANAFLPDEKPLTDMPNRWHVGIRTGPNHDTICVKQCYTNEDVRKYLSPGGSSINEALIKSIRVYEENTPGLENNRTSCRMKKMLAFN